MAGHYTERVVDQAKIRILQASLVISRAIPEHETVEPLGSGILLLLCGEYFLITAGHILNHESWPTLTIPGETPEKKNLTLRLQGELSTSYVSNNEKKQYDFAILRLYPKMHKYFAHLKPFTVQEILMNHNTLENNNYLIAGFPWRSITKLTKSVFSINPFIFLTYGVSKKRYAKHKFPNDIFALVQYQRRLQRFSDKKIIQARNPQGISGSGLYFIPEFSERQLQNPKIFLFGIMIENHQDKGFIVAFKIDMIIEIIRRDFQLYKLQLPFTNATGNIGNIYQGDYFDRVKAIEETKGIFRPLDAGVNRILKPAQAITTQNDN